MGHGSNGGAPRVRGASRAVASRRKDIKLLFLALVLRYRPSLNPKGFLFVCLLSVCDPG